MNAYKEWQDKEIALHQQWKAACAKAHEIAASGKPNWRERRQAAAIHKSLLQCRTARMAAGGKRITNYAPVPERVAALRKASERVRLKKYKATHNLSRAQRSASIICGLADQLAGEL